MRREWPEGGRRKSEPIEHEGLEVINRDYLGGKITLDQANKLVDGLKAQLYVEYRGYQPNRAAVCPEVHQGLYKRYWDLKYKGSEVDESTLYSARVSIWKALKHAENLDLHIAPKEAIEQVFKGLPGGSQRKALAHINGILKMLGRNFSIKPKKRKFEPEQVSEEDMLKFLTAARCEPEAVTALAAFLFYSGLRLGEALMVRTKNLDQESGLVAVTTQWSQKKRTRTKLKNEVKLRAGLVFPQGWHWAERWAALAETTDPNQEWARLITNAWERAGKPGGIKPIPRNLRHSWALMAREAGLKEAAEIMDHSEDVHRKYYTGTAIKLERVKEIAAKWKKSR